MLAAPPRGRGPGALSRILVIGGYGGFGARLTRRLIRRGHHLLVGGRSPEKARRFCDGLDASPVTVDRTGDVAAVLAAERLDLVIDAAGPFQGGDHRVPRACIAAGVPYLDLADARDFVTGIGALDADARTAGVAVVSGASSVPALSGAAARALAAGLDDVRRVDIAISASSRAAAGASVAAAILSYVGRPVTLWRSGRSTMAWGWQELRRERFAVAGAPPLEDRWTALADVPDHDLLPALLPRRPAVTYRAGTEIAAQMLGLWLLSWPVRWFGGSLRPLAPLLMPLQRAMRGLGGERSAMSVTLTGARDGVFVERRWTLIADRGDGPEIPTLAAALLADAVLAGRVPPGARDAAALLRLDDFAGELAGLAIVHAATERPPPPPLYERIMGGRFADLPTALRRLHTVHGGAGASGEAEVERGRHPLARLIARVMRFPPVGVHPLHVAFAERNGVERWTRSFGPHHFSSTLSEAGGRLVERFGPLRFHFDLPSDAAGLTMVMRRWSAVGLPLPLQLAPRSLAREWEQDGAFHFDVSIALPLVGPVVRHRGRLRSSP